MAEKTVKPAGKKIEKKISRVRKVAVKARRLGREAEEVILKYRKTLAEAKRALPKLKRFEALLAKDKKRKAKDLSVLRRNLRKEIRAVGNKLGALQYQVQSTSPERAMRELAAVRQELAKKLQEAQTSSSVQITESSMVPGKTLEETAHDILALYFSEVARLGLKRRLSLDELIDAYSYTIDQLRKRFQLHKPQPSQVVVEKTVEKAPVIVQMPAPAPGPTTGFAYKNSKGITYYLHQKGRLFYFSLNPQESIPLPSGYKVMESSKTGLPILKKQ